MKDENSILYVQTTDQPEKQYSPLVLAQTAKMMDLTPRVYYLGTGVENLDARCCREHQTGNISQCG